MIADVFITLSLLLRCDGTNPFLIPRGLVKIIIGLRRPSYPFILERPIAIPADQLKHDVGLPVYPFIKPLGPAMAIGLHFIQLRSATGGGRLTDQRTSLLTRQ